MASVVIASGGNGLDMDQIVYFNSTFFSYF
jgi:hypothetical protein